MMRCVGAALVWAQACLVVSIAGVWLEGLPVAPAADDMWPGGTYDPQIPAPASVLGYPLGERHTPHVLLQRYLEAVARASDRVELERIGETYLRRAQFHVVISAPANLGRLDEIRGRIRELTRIDGGPDAARVEEIVESTPAIAMLNYSVHGDEASGVEAAIRTVYQLAAGTDETTRKILEELVVVIDPLQNPDGHERYLHFIDDLVVAAPNPDPQSFEHHQPWPGGRTNAYFFDLNRDWFLMTQVESVNRVRALLRWWPQVAPDLHEMGSDSTYFFHPPMLPVNWNLPEVTHKWLEIYGRANAAAFDRFGWSYYTREDFDMLYPGYGESLPSLLGAIGMTYEQASARSRTRERRDGTVFGLRDAAWHHFTTSMATLATTAERRREKLRDFRRFFGEAVLVASAKGIREVYLPPSDPARFYKLVERVQLLGGGVERAAEPFIVKGAHDYLAGGAADVQLPAGTAIISLRQPAGLVLKTILEPDSRLDPSFLEEERRRLERREPTRFYDVTAWNLPMTYGIPAYASRSRTGVPRAPFPPAAEARPAPEPVERARVAYVVPPDTNANIALVIRLLQADYRVRVARRPFVLGDIGFPAGTAVLRVSRNPESLHRDINTFLRATGGRAVAAQTAYTPEGIDLGSSSILAMRRPRVALVAGDAFASYTTGAIRYLFEQVYGLRHSLLRASMLAEIDLHDYNVIVLPRCRSGRAAAIIGAEGLARLKRWVLDGGVLVALGGSIDLLGGDGLELSSAPRYTRRRREPGGRERRGGARNDARNGAVSDAKADPFEVDELLPTPGAILRLRLDDRSFLSWGYPRLTVPALVRGSRVHEPITDDQGLTAARYDIAPAPGKSEGAAGGEGANAGAHVSCVVLSGHVWPEMRTLLAGKAYAWHEGHGRGQVICFAEDPTFRASYDGLDRLFFNAVVFSLAFAP